MYTLINPVNYTSKYTFDFHFQLAEIQDKMKSANQTILTPLISLDTPGKATVEVIILADPVCVKLYR
jgi:hypothetical protein